jgi:RNase P subunit RPR2
MNYILGKVEVEPYKPPVQKVIHCGSCGAYLMTAESVEHTLSAPMLYDLSFDGACKQCGYVERFELTLWRPVNGEAPHGN